MAQTATDEPISQAVHLCIDMQAIFAEGGLWATPWMARVLPGIVALAEHQTSRTIFTRFITPLRPEDRPGRWQRYFRRWSAATREQLPADALELVPPLARLAPPATVIDKPAYSAFVSSSLASVLESHRITTVIITGSETDVCVLATVLDAVDRGLRVIVVEDGLCSSSDAGHDALMTMYRTRFTEQIELLRLEDVLRLWNEP